MTIQFGLDFDGPVFRGNWPESAHFFGPKTLLRWLETTLGLGVFPENTDYLRIELFRQSLQQHLTENPTAFFARSFEADRFATAQGLLDWRDELRLVGFDFQFEKEPPSRLLDFIAVEHFFQNKLADPLFSTEAIGLADRFCQVLEKLDAQKPALETVVLFEPLDLLPPIWKRIFKAFEKNGTVLKNHKIEISTSENDSENELHFFKQVIENQGLSLQKPTHFRGQNLFIFRAARETDAAIFLAQFLKKHPSLAPVFLIPEMNRTLENAFAQEGLPSMGILSASLARPSLQILKLAPAFLFEPIDVFKIMEFVTLPVKPLDDALALRIARLLSEKPGLNNDNWLAATHDFFEKTESKEAKKQFDFWFSRRRVPSHGAVAKSQVIAIYEYLNHWASTTYEEMTTKLPSLLVLSEQARRIRDLLEALPETQLSFLELERIVRTIYSPSPIQFAAAEVGHFPFVHQSGGLAATVENLVWWNCTFHESPRLPSRWNDDERAFFKKIGLEIDSAERQNRLNRLRQMQPVLQAKQRLFLVFPEKTEGAEAQPNLLFGDLEAILGDLQPFTCHLENEADRARLDSIFRLPKSIFLEKNQVRRTAPFVQIPSPEAILESEYETLTSLESLFYYPYQWFLKGKLRLRPASILSVTTDSTLLGNLAHRFFELLFNENIEKIDRKTLFDWVDATAPRLFEREGATLLLYGREPERAAFLTKIKRASWSLVSLLAENNWTVEATEKSLEGSFCGLPVRCKPDLILRRENGEQAVVDLKWAGANRRKDMIRNEEDLQLVMYSKLLETPENKPHTAYFIIEEAKMIARNSLAFRQSLVAGGADDHEAAAARIFEKMEKTFAWRKAQLERGELEIRTKTTAASLEQLYEGQLFELLEMRSDSARWDDFAVLVRAKT